MTNVNIVFKPIKYVEMKIQIENLKAQMRGIKLNLHQRADALVEFNKLVEYTENLEIKVENLGIHGVINWAYFPEQKPNRFDVIIIQPPPEQMTGSFITIYDEHTEITDGCEWAKL